MQFFFVPDHRENFRFISSEPIHDIAVDFSRWKKLWATAKEKLMLLPARILRQEQAFQNITKTADGPVPIHFPEDMEDKKVRRRFFFFLQKQKTTHILLLVGETILLPISGLMALLPGPNVFFGVLALLMYTHWQALRGILSLGKKEHTFIPCRFLSDWHQAVRAQRQADFPGLLDNIAAAHQLTNLHKVLYK
jgi:hypothetical protein